MFMEPSHLASGSHGEKSQRSRPSSPARPEAISGSDAQDAVILAYFSEAAASGAGPDQSNPYLPAAPATGFYHWFHTLGLERPQLPPLSSLDSVWNRLTHLQGPHPPFDLQSHAGIIPPIPPISFDSPTHNLLAQLPADNMGETSGSSLQPAQQVMTPISTSWSPPGDIGDAGDIEHMMTAEEKRRRNTTASARFRIKKKQRTVNLERSVSDLTGRAEELEKEAADLRRENGWLKEIVMLKGTQLAAVNLQQRLLWGQVIQAAGIDLRQEQIDGEGRPEGSLAGKSSSEADVAQEEELSNEESDESNTKKKGKGKRPVAKGKRK